MQVPGPGANNILIRVTARIVPSYFMRFAPNCDDLAGFSLSRSHTFEAPSPFRNSDHKSGMWLSKLEPFFLLSLSNKFFTNFGANKK